MTLYAYQGMRPDLSARIDQAHPEVSRRIAYELTAQAANATPTQRGQAALMAVQGGMFGDTELRRLLKNEATAAEDRYEILRDQREDAEEAGTLFPPDLQAELDGARRTARLYQLFVYALSDDPVEAAQQCAYMAGTLLPASQTDDLVQRILDETASGQSLGFPQGWQ